MPTTANDLRTHQLREAASLYMASLDPAGRRAQNAAARATFQAQLEQQARDEGATTPEEIAYKVKHYRSAMMSHLSRLAAEARRKKAKERRQREEAAEMDALEAVALEALAS